MGIGIYRASQQEQNPLIPDAFLSIGVERFKNAGERFNYVIAEENEIIPQLAIEIVCEPDEGEYDRQLLDYARWGVLYYVVYNPDNWQRDRRDPLEVYRLVEGEYARQFPLIASSNREGCKKVVWMPEIGLGIGCDRGIFQSWQRDWLYWYNERGDRYSFPEEMLQQRQDYINQQREQLDQLNAKLIELGIDPDEL
jgi:Uma2 family endonuclease